MTEMGPVHALAALGLLIGGAVACGGREDQKSLPGESSPPPVADRGIKVSVPEPAMPLDTSRADSLRLVARARSVLPLHTGDIYVSYYHRDRAGADVEFSPVQRRGVVTFDGVWKVRVTPAGPAWIVYPQIPPKANP